MIASKTCAVQILLVAFSRLMCCSRVCNAKRIAGRPAILPALRGRAWITGFHSYLIDPADPWPEGFLLADMMGAGTGMSQ